MRKAIVLYNAIAPWLISFGVTKLKKIKEEKNISHNAEATQRLLSAINQVISL